MIPIYGCSISWRAANSDGSPPRFSSTRAASGCIGCEITARVPALDAVRSEIPICLACMAVSRSAVGDRQIGDRQMFPVQINKMRRFALASIFVSVVPSTQLVTYASDGRGRQRFRTGARGRCTAIADRTHRGWSPSIVQRGALDRPPAGIAIPGLRRVPTPEHEGPLRQDTRTVRRTS